MFSSFSHLNNIYENLLAWQGDVFLDDSPVPEDSRSPGLHQIGGVMVVCGAGGTELSRARCGCIASLALEAALRNFSKTRPGH